MNNKRNSIVILAKNISMDKEYVNVIIKHMQKHNINAYVIGKIIPGHKDVVVINDLIW